jgi:hypothetical protein
MATSTTEIQRLANLTASERAAERNAKTREWVEAEPGRWAGFFSEDDEWWSDRGVFTGLDFECNMLASEISDTYKERHGVRPRHYRFEEMTLPEMEKVLSSLTPTAEEIAEWEAEWKADEEAWKRYDAVNVPDDFVSDATIEEDEWYEVQDALSGF